MLVSFPLNEEEASFLSPVPLSPFFPHSPYSFCPSTTQLPFPLLNPGPPTSTPGKLGKNLPLSELLLSTLTAEARARNKSILFPLSHQCPRRHLFLWSILLLPGVPGRSLTPPLLLAPEPRIVGPPLLVAPLPWPRCSCSSSPAAACVPRSFRHSLIERKLPGPVFQGLWQRMALGLPFPTVNILGASFSNSAPFPSTRSGCSLIPLCTLSLCLCPHSPLH